MGLAFTQREFSTPIGRRAALVITPTAHVRVGLERLTELREASSQPARLAPIDEEILAQAQRRAGSVQVAVFRGQDDSGHGSYGLDGVNELQANELAYLMLRSQLIVYRGLMRAGLCLHLHVEWPPTALDAFRHAVRRRLSELDPSPGESISRTAFTPIDQADLWVLRNLVFYFSMRFENLIANLLPDKLSLMERRMERIRQMVLALPERAFEMTDSF